MSYTKHTTGKKQISPEEMLLCATGTLKHEGMFLTTKEEALLLANLRGEISDEEFMKRSYELATKGSR